MIYRHTYMPKSLQSYLFDMHSNSVLGITTYHPHTGYWPVFTTIGYKAFCNVYIYCMEEFNRIIHHSIID